MPPSKRQRSGVNTSVARGLPAEDSASEDASSKKRGGLEDESGTSDADGEGSADDFDDCSGDEDEDEDKEEEYSSNSEEEEPAIRRLMSRVPHPECSRGFHVGLMAHTISRCSHLSLIVGEKTITNPVVAMTTFVSIGLSSIDTQNMCTIRRLADRLCRIRAG